MPSLDTPVYAGPPSNPAIAKALGIAIEPKPGSMEVHCSECSQLMWIGPLIIAASAVKPLPFLCYVCALKAGATPDDLVPLGPGGHGYKDIASEGPSQ